MLATSWYAGKRVDIGCLEMTIIGLIMSKEGKKYG